MQKIIYDSQYFNIKDTLECGQIFRFKPYKLGYLVFSKDKCAYCYTLDNNTVIECEDSDRAYFEYYFDLSRDYSEIYNQAVKQNIEILTRSATLGKGVRILNQDPTEMLFSFIISQNNNIPRIKGIIERLSNSLGEQMSFMGEIYFSFPTANMLSQRDNVYYQAMGLGYRAEYIRRLAVNMSNGFSVDQLTLLDTKSLKNKLISIHGVGRKVCDCVSLFGFHRLDSFPVDTWIEKVYKEDFKGELTDREKIAEWFVDKFGQNSGYFQQYLFYYKRSLENK